MASGNSQLDEILAAVALSGNQDSIGTQITPTGDIQVGMTSTYEEDITMKADRRIATGSKARAAAGTIPGQSWSPDNTTCYNPLPSDPRVELVLGKRVYKEAPKSNKMAELEREIAELKKLIMSGAVGSTTDSHGDGSAPSSPKRSRSRHK
jgi:hypothetical protein